jgi:hypothetical protein
VRESENSIGNAYRDGRGVDKNLQTAAEVGPQSSLQQQRNCTATALAF